MVADSLSAIQYARVRVIRDSNGLAVDYAVSGDFPRYGNNDDRADRIAVGLVEQFMTKVRRYSAYRDAIHTQSVLTITSNVVYGKHTGDTPDGNRMWIRFVLVPGLTDDPANVEGIASFVSTLKTVDRVEVLPFHKLGAAKYTKLGMVFPLEHVPTPDVALIERARDQFAQRGTPVF